MRRRSMPILALAALAAAFLLACSPSRLLGVDGVSQYVSDVRAPLADFTAWAGEVVQFANEGLRTRDVDTICTSGRTAELVAQGRDIASRLEAITPPSSLEAPHDAVQRAAEGAADSLEKANEQVCQGNDLEGGLESLAGSLGAVEGLLEKLRDLQAVLPGS